jgi:hypothetical protein
MLLAYNQQTGDSATRSFGPDHSQASVAATAAGLPVAGTDRFDFENFKTADDIRSKFQSITIQTTPEEAQAVIQVIRTHPDGDYTTYWNNCTTTCSKLLRSIRKTSSHALLQKRSFPTSLGNTTKGQAMMLVVLQAHGTVRFGQGMIHFSSFLMLSLKTPHNTKGLPHESFLIPYSQFQINSSNWTCPSQGVVLSNCSTDGITLWPVYRKPFDLIFNRAKTEEWCAREDSNF